LLEIYIKKITFQDKTVIVVNIQEHLSRWGWSIRFGRYFHDHLSFYNFFHLSRDIT